MAGSWISAVYGFAGMRELPEALAFSPALPKRWSRLAFSIAYRGRRIGCEYRRGSSAYRLLEGEGLEIVHEGKRYRLTREETVEVDESPRPLAWILDLDGVIADTAELHYRAWKRLAEELGLGFDRRANEALKGLPRMASLRRVLGPAWDGCSEGELAELAERKNRHYLELLRGLGPGDVLPGMGGFLGDLKRSGARIALASASHNAPEVLARLGIEALFDAVVDPASVAMPKPDPEIFLRAAALLGARLLDCVAVEDAQAGIDAIKAAGMFAVGIGEGLVGADLLLAESGCVERAAIEAAFQARNVA
jgi:alpha,alpha-trehalose phosphorylase